MTMMIEFLSPDGSSRVMVEADQRTVYAYLQCNGEIVSDVWLANLVEPPQAPEWKDQGAQLPFLNPGKYCRRICDRQFALNDLSVAWGEERGAVSATLLSGDGRYAVLVDGVKPGWCFNAIKDGPLAKSWPSEQPSDGPLAAEQ